MTGWGSHSYLGHILVEDGDTVQELPQRIDVSFPSSESWGKASGDGVEVSGAEGRKLSFEASGLSDPSIEED